MEVLSAALAAKAYDLRLDCTVEALDLKRHEVIVRRGGRAERMGYEEALLSTVPLPVLAELCADLPPGLRQACAGLRRNRVLSVAW